MSQLFTPLQELLAGERCVNVERCTVFDRQTFYTNMLCYVLLGIKNKRRSFRLSENRSFLFVWDTADLSSGGLSCLMYSIRKRCKL